MDHITKPCKFTASFVILCFHNVHHRKEPDLSIFQAVCGIKFLNGLKKMHFKLFLAVFGSVFNSF